MDIDNIYLDNSLESIKFAQHCVYLLVVFYALTFFICVDNNFRSIKLPLLDITTSSKESTLFFIAVMYFVNGILMSFSVRKAIINICKISCSEVQLALRNYPLTLTSNGFFCLLIISSIAGPAFCIFDLGFHLPFYFSWPLTLLFSGGYIDAFFKAKEKLHY